MVTEARPLLGIIDAINEFEGGPHPLWYLARGHVDKQEFVRELRLDWGLEADVEDVQHKHARLIPVGPEMPGVMTIHLSEPGRGAFHITYLDAEAHSIRNAEESYDVS